MAAAKKTEAPVTAKKSFPKPTERDFEVIKKPLVTEKSMAGMQGANKVTLKVSDDTNKSEVKLAFQRVFQVKVNNVQILNVKAKVTTRGTRYKGAIQGYKKAIVTLAEGEAIDLFKE